MNEKKIQMLEARVKNLEAAFAAVGETMSKLVGLQFEIVLVLAKAVPVEQWPRQMRKFHEQSVASLAKAGIDPWSDASATSGPSAYTARRDPPNT